MNGSNSLEIYFISFFCASTVAGVHNAKKLLQEIVILPYLRPEVRAWEGLYDPILIVMKV